jgi:predicted lipoprotein
MHKGEQARPTDSDTCKIKGIDTKQSQNGPENPASADNTYVYNYIKVHNNIAKGSDKQIERPLKRKATEPNEKELPQKT